MNRYGALFLTARAVYRVFWPSYRLENFPTQEDGPVVFVSRHQKFNGMCTVVGRIRTPIRVWVLDVLVGTESCQKQMLDFTLTQRYHLRGLTARFCSKVVGWAISGLMRSMDAIPVYRGKKEIVKTFRISSDTLKSGESVLIFPDVDYTDKSPEAGSMYSGFINLARMAHKDGVDPVRFVPLYTSRRSHAILAGDPVVFNPDVPFAYERERIAAALHEAINDLAVKAGDKEE